MSRDIRSYFLSSGNNKRKDSNKGNSKDEISVKPQKRQLVVLDSDSEEDPLPKEVKKHKTNPAISPPSGKNEKKNKSEKVSNTGLKLVSAADVFGSSLVKRAAVKTSQKPKEDDVKLLLEDQHSDLEFERTLRDLDEQENSYHKKTAAEKEKKHTQNRTSDKNHKDDELEVIEVRDKHRHSSGKDSKEKCSSVSEKLVNGHEKKKDKQKSESSSLSSDRKRNVPEASREKHRDVKEAGSKTVKEKQAEEAGNKSAKEKQTDVKEIENKTVKKKQTEVKEAGNKSVKEKQTDVKETGNKNVKEEESVSLKERKKSSDDSFSEDAFEKKRLHAIQYQRYLSREGPRNPGGKEIPEGKPGCLSGLVFVLTGVLETIDRDETAAIIQKYGGRVTSNVSRNTSYLVVGDEPGPSKIGKATKLGTKQLTEDGLLDLIRTRSGTSDKVEETSKIKKKIDNKIEEHNERKIKVSEKTEEKQSSSTDKKNEKSTKYPSLKEKKSFTSEEDIFFPVKKEETKISSSLKTVSSDVKPSSLWVDKYQPTSIKQIIGQQGDRSNVKKLMKWLENWHSNHSGKKKAKANPWGKDDSGSYFKAALLSGPPGVGKTTTAHLVCKELGFDVVEFNASDTRSKKLLHEEITEMLSSRSLKGYLLDDTGKRTTEKLVLVMDEVDGMAGNEDRGGMQQLILLIKVSKIPVICMCNDRHHPKIRSLSNYCFDLQFSKPRVEQIRGAMMSICYREGVKITPDALNDIIGSSNQDIRQILHHLSMWSVKDKQLSSEQVKEESQKAKKDLKLGPWDVLRKVFSADAHKTMSIYEKSDLFFHDYSLGPLFVHENYLGVLPHKAKGNKNKHLEIVARTAESLSCGDLVEKTIRSRNAWSLLPTQAMFSSVIPGDLMEGHLTTQINFPAWLGKNSRRNKYSRLVQELNMHMRLRISGTRESVNLDYLQHIRDALVNPLIKEGSEGVATTLNVLNNYQLLKDDIDSIVELSLWPNQKDPMSLVESKVKAALTRTYNKEGLLPPHAAIRIKMITAKSSQDADMDIDGDEENDEEEEQDITKDTMIKAKKRPASSRAGSSGEGPAPKKGKGGGKGAGKKESKNRGKK